MRWPDGRRCAVVVTFDFDAETLWLSRDRANARKLSTMSFGAYGAKVGVPKALELLRELELPATFFVPGWTAERHTDKVEAVLKDGHEVAHHGYLHLWPDPDKPAEVEREIEQGLAALERTVGVRPVGYRAPAGETTLPLLRRLRAEGFLYDSSFKDDVVPYRHALAGAELIELPENPSCDDTAYGFTHLATPRPLFPKEHVLSIWRDEFRATREWGGLFMLVLHPQVSGRPLRYAILREFLQFARGFDDVWFANCRQVAEAFAQQEGAQ